MDEQVDDDPVVIIEHPKEVEKKDATVQTEEVVETQEVVGTLEVQPLMEEVEEESAKLVEMVKVGPEVVEIADVVVPEAVEDDWPVDDYEDEWPVDDKLNIVGPGETQEDNWPVQNEAEVVGPVKPQEIALTSNSGPAPAPIVDMAPPPLLLLPPHHPLHLHLHLHLCLCLLQLLHYSPLHHIHRKRPSRVTLLVYFLCQPYRQTHGPLCPRLFPLRSDVLHILKLVHPRPYQRWFSSSILQKPQPMNHLEKRLGGGNWSTIDVLAEHFFLLFWHGFIC